MPESVTVTGMVLSAMPVGENDKRLVILTKEFGKISAFAKGARKLNSALMACSQPFTFGEFYLSIGRSSYIITGINITNYFADLRKDIDSVYYGIYFCEFSEYITRENIDGTDILKLLYQTLRALSKKTINYKLIRCVFELKAMTLNGEAPQVFQCVKCQRSFDSAKIPRNFDKAKTPWDLESTNIPGKFENAKIPRNSNSAISPEYFDNAKITGSFNSAQISGNNSIKNTNINSLSASSAILEYKYRFSVTCGGILCETCQSYDRNAISIKNSSLYTMQYIISREIEKLYTFTVTDEVLAELRLCIKNYLNRYIDHEFKSLELIKTL